MKRRHITRFFLNNADLTPVNPERDQHLVCGAGGTRAIIGCTGAIVGLHAQGYHSWATIGGISGGAFPAVLFAAGVPLRNLIRRCLSSDFATLLKRNRHLFDVIRKFILQGRDQRLPRTAIHCSKEMVKFLDKLVPVWPDKFWTMCVADVPGKGRCQVLFTKAGAFVYTKDGFCKQISSTPPSVGTAVAGSCAIPGVIDHIEYMGMHLYDGMLSWDGRTPAGLVKKHFGAEYEDIVAVDVGGLKPAFPGLQQRILAYLCDEDCHPDTHKRAEDWERLGVKVVRANVNAFGSLNLNPTRDQRSNALRLGYRATLRALTSKKKVKINPTASALLDSPFEQLQLRSSSNKLPKVGFAAGAGRKQKKAPRSKKEHAPARSQRKPVKLPWRRKSDRDNTPTE